jgi:iron complex transport system substrate-binding protein
VELVARLRGRVAAVRDRAASLRPVRVALIEWIAPLMAAGNWMPTLAALAGGVAVGGGAAGRHSPFMTLDALSAAAPEVIVILPCGFDLARTRREWPLLAAQPGWAVLPAVRTGRVFLADGNQYFNRPGPRIVESLEILAELLHPDEFHFGHAGRGWERVPPSSASRAGLSPATPSRPDRRRAPRRIPIRASCRPTRSARAIRSPATMRS